MAWYCESLGRIVVFSAIEYLRSVHLCAFWWSNVAVWVKPVACSHTDADLGSDVWICLEIHTTTLAKSGPRSGVDFWTQVHHYSRSLVKIVSQERHNPSRVVPLCAFWWSNVAVWVKPVACSHTDADLGSDVWICLEIHTTTLAKSGPPSGVDFWTQVHHYSSSPRKVLTSHQESCPCVYNDSLKINFAVNTNLCFS